MVQETFRSWWLREYMINIYKATIQSRDSASPNKVNHSNSHAQLRMQEVERRNNVLSRLDNGKFLGLIVPCNA